MSPPPSNDERIRRAIEMEGITKIYFNGFVLATGQGDITAVLERNNAPIAVVNMSYTVAKTFALKLGQTIASFETVTDRQMLTTDEIEAKFIAKLGQDQ